MFTVIVSIYEGGDGTPAPGTSSVRHYEVEGFNASNLEQVISSMAERQAYETVRTHFAPVSGLDANSH